MLPIHARLREVIIVCLLVPALLFVPLPSAQATNQDIEKSEFFESRVRPVLANNCYSCHTTAHKGGLRLDSRESIVKGGDRGPAIVSGRPEESLLIKAVNHTHEHLKMPLGGSKLSGEEIASLTKWIRDGAFWPESPGEFFTSRVRPVLAKNCMACHGSDASLGGLRLDSRENLLKGGASGPAVVPGDPEKSILIQAVRHTHARFKMPSTKKLEDREIADLVEWVRAGAAWSDASTPASASTGEYVITPEQRAFWSFQPLRNSLPPGVKNKAWARTPIDNFILSRLEKKGLAPTSTADKRTLLRRATFDLTGLPPTPGEIDAFLADQSPNAFERVIDRLLASPHYGERWGRHWLDVVRYADSAGDSADYPVPQVYLYRNYVIDSLNLDKPYDQFLREQIAGDLLPGKSENEKWERTIATGYLAIARRFSVRPERNMHLTIDDTIDNVGKSVLGLTVGCARCHDHKYDPIPAKDYYALYGIFDSTRYPFAGSENVQEQKDLVFRKPKSEVEALLKPFHDQLAPLDEEIKRLQEEKKSLDNQDEVDTQQQTAVETTGKRTLKQIDADIAAIKKRRVPIIANIPSLERAFAVAEGSPHDARVQRRGEPKNPGDEVPRRFLKILGGQQLPAGVSSSGRLQLAEWITDPKNPLTARVMVNRIWQNHFGKGLVTTPSDFGKRGKPPTHPELLDYLAGYFIKSGWRMKALHKLIMTSRVYQLASSGQPQNAGADAENSLLWKFNRRRLDAESIRDSILKISGDLDTTRGEAHPFPAESTWNYTQHRPFAANYETKRRSVYLMTQRIQRHPFLSIFDGADANASTPERVMTTTPIQALFMMNSSFLHEQAELFAVRLIKAEASDASRVNLAHRLTLGRPASVEEMKMAENYLKQSREKLGIANVALAEREQKALASYLRALLSSNEFIYLE